MRHTAENSPSTFQDHFFNKNAEKQIIVPNYQRAYSWKKKQIEIFIEDLVQNASTNSEYYFGHFISEDTEDHLEIVDGQQRITTFALFLIVCRFVSDYDYPAYSLIDRFMTVGYDNDALQTILDNLPDFIKEAQKLRPDEDPNKDTIIESCKINELQFTSSQRRIALTLLQFFRAYDLEKGKLDKNHIKTYIDSIMESNCSHHITDSKSVAVNIFEMHNTRGMPLSTMEIVKAKLMKYVYDNSKNKGAKEKNVAQIQEYFGRIYQLEFLLNEKSFHGKLSLEQLFRYHLRVIDDGKKTSRDEFIHPATNSDQEDLIKYLDQQLTQKENGKQYALDVAREFLKSVEIMSKIIPAWDNLEGAEHLVGDVLILDSSLSIQFFLLYCRKVEEGHSKFTKETILHWEKLVYTHDFHGLYHGKRYRNREDFELLFEKYLKDPASLEDIIKTYVVEGFQNYFGSDLQTKVVDHFESNRENILNQAYTWWRHKFKYCLYKYEKDDENIETHKKRANLEQLRKIMRGATSVEHILPQEWTGFNIVKGTNEVSKAKIAKTINGLGNLLLVTSSKNSSLSNKPPAEKSYIDLCSGGSYSKHEENIERWRKPIEWPEIIQKRGEEIYQFALTQLLGGSNTI